MDVPQLFDTVTTELERMLTSKTVVGEPIKVDGTTVVPLISLGFGFGVGAGEGTDPGGKGRGQGGGTGGGGGVKPVAVVVIDNQGVRLESVKSAGSVLGKVADSVTELARSKLGTTPLGEASKE